MKIKITALAMALLMLLSTYGCTKDAPKIEQSDTPYEEKGSTPDAENKEETEDSVVDARPTEFPSETVLNKIEEVNGKRLIIADGGLYYSENGLYGVMSFDGKYDTGAKYVECSPKGGYFVVAESLAPSIEPSDINRCGLINAKGEEIVPMEYAGFFVENYRFVRAVKATERTENKDEAIVYMTDKQFSLTVSEGDLMYKGEWEVYDALQKSKIPGVKSTNNYVPTVYGDLMSYYIDDQTKESINYKGEKLPDGAKIYAGTNTYSVTEGDDFTMYDPDGKILFEMNVEDKRVNDIDYSESIDRRNFGEYLGVSDYKNDKYYVINLKGEKVSADFDENIYYYNGILNGSDSHQIYNFNGDVLTEGTYDYVSVEKNTGVGLILRNDNEYKIIDVEGNILMKAEITDSFDYYDSVPKMDDEGVNDRFYSFKDKDFTIMGRGGHGWLVETLTDKDNYLYGVVDSFTGKTLIKDYEKISSRIVSETGKTYIYAENDNKTDIFEVEYK